MENDNLGNKKINEGFSGENLPDDYNPAPTKLKQELETDENGDTKCVDRARPEDAQNQTSGNPPSDKEKMKLTENKDRNSDVAANRYPPGHPDNEHDRGNIKLDDE